MPITCDRIAAKVSPQATLLRLGNGITLVHQEMPAAVVSVDVWVKAGATSDPEHCLGMAHFLEHMIFKGTEVIAVGEFDLLIESEGGISNAATSLDYAHYNLTVATKHLAIALSYLSQMLLEAKIDGSELEQERLVVLEELRQAMDDPDWIAYQHLMETAYGNHVYSRSVLGSAAVVSQITAAQMREYHRTHYRPENMTVAIAGAVTLEDAIRVVDAAFTSDTFSRNISRNILNQGVKEAIAKDQNKDQNLQNLPTISAIRRHSISLPMVQHTRLHMAWMGASVADLEDAIQLELVTTILTEGRSTRLVRELLEESDLVLDLAGSCSIQQDSSLFTISAYLDAENLEIVEHRILRQIKNLQNHLISEVELNKAKRSLCNHFIFALESPSQLASFLGYHSLMGCDDLCIDWSNAYCEIIRKVQPSDLQALVKKYLSLENYVITRAVPDHWLGDI